MLPVENRRTSLTWILPAECREAGTVEQMFITTTFFPSSAECKFGTVRLAIRSVNRGAMSC